jgi:hypothetical protein
VALGERVAARIDDHVIDAVWELYRLAHRLTGGVSTLLEWDAKIPEFPVVHAEVETARNYMDSEGPVSSMQSPCELDGSASVRTAAERRHRGSTVPHPASFVTAEVE